MDKNEIYILIAIGTIIGAVFLKFRTVPWWLVILGAVAGGAMGYFAFGATVGDFLLGAAAGAIGPHLISTVIDGVKSFISRKLGSSTTTATASMTVLSHSEQDVTQDPQQKDYTNLREETHGTP